MARPVYISVTIDLKLILDTTLSLVRGCTYAARSVDHPLSAASQSSSIVTVRHHFRRSSQYLLVDRSRQRTLILRQAGACQCQHEVVADRRVESRAPGSLRRSVVVETMRLSNGFAGGVDSPANLNTTSKGPTIFLPRITATASQPRPSM